MSKRIPKEVCDLFLFEEETGVLLWNVNKPRTRIGATAGYVTAQGYRYVQVNGDVYPVHHIIYSMKHVAEINESHIDHIDGNKLNNRLDNLRLVSAKINNRNKPMTSRNKSGHMGISMHSITKKWRVQLNTDYGKKHIGYFDDINTAIKKRDDAYLENGYTKNHGRYVII